MTRLEKASQLRVTVTGKDLFKPINKAAKATEKMAKATGDTADNIEEAKNQLAGFDQMNVMNDQSSKNGGSGGYDDTEVWEAIENIEAVLDKKADTDKVDEYLKEKQADEKYNRTYRITTEYLR